MKSNLEIYLIYCYASQSRTQVYHTDNEIFPKQSYYYVLDLFSEVSEINRDLLVRLYHELHGGHSQLDEEKIGPFQDLEELNRYALKVADELLSPAVFVLSAVDYNNALENLTLARDLKAIFRANGTRLENQKYLSGRSNFFRRIFKDT